VAGFRAGWCTFVVLDPRLGTVWCVTRKSTCFGMSIFLYSHWNPLSLHLSVKVTGHNLRFVSTGARVLAEVIIRDGLEYFYMKKNTIDMTSGNPAKHILNFTVPLILTNMGQQLYMIVDGAIVGRGVGVKALAAVGATDWCYWLILWTVGGLAQGFSTFVSRAFGERDYSEMNKTIAAAAELCFFIGLFFTVAGIAVARPLLHILNMPADILPGASAYLMTMISGTLIVMGYNLTSAILRGLGDGKTPLVAMVVAALLNIGLDAPFEVSFPDRHVSSCQFIYVLPRLPMK